jgi:hypothetical protein
VDGLKPIETSNLELTLEGLHSSGRNMAFIERSSELKAQKSSRRRKTSDSFDLDRDNTTESS